MSSVRDDWEMECPKCRSDSKIMILASTWVALTFDGTEDMGGHEWDEDSSCMCQSCGHRGTVFNFQLQDEPEEKRHVYVVLQHYDCADTIMSVFDSESIANMHALKLARDAYSDRHDGERPAENDLSWINEQMEDIGRETYRVEDHTVWESSDV